MSIGESSQRERLSWLPALVTIGIVLMGISWAAFGLFEYGIWVNNGPGAGFFPFVMGVGAAVVGTYELFFSPVKARAVGFKSLWPAVAIALAILSIPLFGMVPAMAIFIVLWVFVIEQKPWHKSLLTGIGAGIVLYLVFGLWLKVPFPQGMFLELLQ